MRAGKSWLARRSQRTLAGNTISALLRATPSRITRADRDGSIILAGAPASFSRDTSAGRVTLTTSAFR